MKRIVLITLAVMLFCGSALAADYTVENNVAVYAKYSGQVVTAMWDAPTTGGAPEYYKVSLLRLSGEEILETWELGQTTGVQWLITLPKAGYYAVKVAAVNAAGEGPPATSTDPATARVDGAAMGWALRAKLAPVTGLGME